MREQVIDITRQTTADANTVFAMLLDAEQWPSWSPLGSASLERRSPDGPGAIGEIRVFRTGRWTNRELVIASERPVHFAYELLSGLPLRGYQAHVRITPGATGATINWRSSFRPRIPGTGRLIRRGLGRFITELVDGLAAAAATNDAVAPSAEAVSR